MPQNLTKESIQTYLQEINSRLAKEGKTGEILIAGGASMTLVFGARDATQDVDAIFTPKNDIANIAAQIADEYGLPDDWLNDGVKGFLEPTMQTEIVYQMDALTVKSISADSLLAMKLTSARPDTKDLEDSIALIKHLKLQNMEQVYDVLQKYIPESRLTARVDFFAQEAFEQFQTREKEQPEQEKKINGQDLESEGRGEMEIIQHARVHNGDLFYEKIEREPSKEFERESKAPHKLTESEIHNYFQEINSRLAREGKTGEMLIAGSAAMTYVYGMRKETPDIDAIFSPRQDIIKIAAQVAEESDWPDDLLNENGWFIELPDRIRWEQAETTTIYENEALTVKSVSADSLLAEALASASRYGNDLDDSISLMGYLHVNNMNQIYEILRKYIPKDRLTGDVNYFAQEAFELYTLCLQIDKYACSYLENAFEVDTLCAKHKNISEQYQAAAGVKDKDALKIAMDGLSNQAKAANWLLRDDERILSKISERGLMPPVQEGQGVILFENSLGEPYRKPDYQVWLVTQNMGDTFKAVSLKDMTAATWKKSDVLATVSRDALLNSQALPNWGKDNLRTLSLDGQDTTQKLTH